MHIKWNFCVCVREVHEEFSNRTLRTREVYGFLIVLHKEKKV